MTNFRQDHDLEVQIADIARMGDVLRIVLGFHHAEARAISEMNISAKRTIEQLEPSQEAVDFCTHLITTFASELQKSFERRQAA